MGESSWGSDLFNELAHEFAERCRRGERPSPAEYVERYPQLADEIRELFPMLAMIERAGSDADGPPESTVERPRRDAAVPERLGDYRILREIGRGGMGVVYEAVQESLGRHVALKVLSPDRPAGPVALTRFQREARTAALLHHTNIVPVFGVGEHEGVSYYAMQYIRGRGLDAVLREVAAQRRGSGGGGGGDPLPTGLATGLVTGRYSDLSVAAGAFEVLPPSTSEPDEPRDGRAAVPATGGADRPSSDSSLLRGAESPYYREVARMARQAAEALAYAHAHGVVHRDIKPSNLLLDVQGTVWVTDFGLAKAEGSDELTRTGDVVGTLRYLAPERFQGRADARSDIYGLGVTLYEMLALQPAFPSPHRVRLMHAILHDEPRRPREHDPGIPRDLETIVLKAIARTPADRFPDAGAMAAELGRFVEGRPIRSRRPSIPERVWRWSRRNPALAASSLAAAALAVIVVVGSVWAAWFYREQRDAVTRAKRDTEASLGRALAAEREAADRRDQAQAAQRERSAELVRTLLLRARAERLSGRADRRDEALRALTRAAGFAREAGAPTDVRAELRDEVIAATALDEVRPVRTAPGLEPEFRVAAYAFEADRYVLVDRDGTIHVHRLSDRSEIRAVAADRPATRLGPLLSAGGRFLTIWSGPSQIELWDLERGEVPAAWPADARGVAHRPDGRQLAVLRADGELRVYDLPDLTESARHRLGFDVTEPMQSSWMGLSDDGRRLAVVRGDWKGVDVFDVASGRAIRTLPGSPPRSFGAVVLDQTGALLALASDQVVTIYDVASGEPLTRLQAHEDGGVTPYFQPGGGLLATTGWSGTTRLWDPIRGRSLATLIGGFRGWHHDRTRFVIFTGQVLTTYRLAAGVGRRTIDARALGGRTGADFGGPARVEYSPDGRLLALPLRPDGVRIVRASDGRPLARLPIGDCHEALFLPDGGLLTYNGRGVWRWPIRPVVAGALRLGPPQLLATIEQPGDPPVSGLTVAANGHVAGVTALLRPGVLLLDPDRPSRRTWLAPHAGAFSIAISPDGRWAVTGSNSLTPASRQLRVWDAADGALVAQLAVGPARVTFSPDGRWLGVGGPDRYRFYRAGTWAPVAEVGHGDEGGFMPLRFHPGGRVAATTTRASRAVARLVEVETGRVLAALEPPDPAPIHFLTFSPDGRHLAVVQADQLVHLWDLDRIRRELDELGLAAGLPDAFGAAAGAAGDPTAVDRIGVAGADPAGLALLGIRQVLREAWAGFRALSDPGLDAEGLVERGGRWDRLGYWRLAAADYRAALARRPNSPAASHALARLLADEPSRGDADEAVRRARAALGRWRARSDDRRTLALALYRAGRLAEAAFLLESDLPRDPNEAGLAWLLLAMSRQRLGQAVAARAALAEAVRWRAARPRIDPGLSAEFDRRLREARSLPGWPLPDLPADVFGR
jgi:serine/threonine protein kinase/WD40 repeat protein